MMTMYISPYRRLAGLREAMDRIIEETANETAPTEREMLLAVDVQAEDEGYVIRALVPGLEGEDLNIEILNNTITLRGELKTGAAHDARYLTHELPSGRFARVISLPVAVDANQVEAALANGVLTLKAPKAEAHRPKAIKVNAN